MIDKPYSLTIKMSEVSIDPIVLDNLASEFYGSIVVPAGPSDDETQTIEFKNHLHPVFKTKIAGFDMMRAFSAALDSYRLPTA